jgi:signal transduction histidine kinase
MDADKARLLQAFTNILQNAFEAYEGRTTGKIRVRARVDGSHVVVTFADDGCGMSEEAVRDSIHLYSTSKEGGTGFGLPLAKKIVETEHGGALSLTSRKGKGTTVTVVLPIKQTKRQERRP